MGFMMDLVSVWFGFFSSVILYVLTKLIRFGWGFSVSGLWNQNRTTLNIFLNILIGLIDFFSWFGFFSYFFCFLGSIKFSIFLFHLWLLSRKRELLCELKDRNLSYLCFEVWRNLANVIFLDLEISFWLFYLSFNFINCSFDILKNLGIFMNSWKKITL
jgi:hypothetical protein